MTATLSSEEKEYLAQCEELFKDRFTEKDEEFMKVYNAEPPTPPIIEAWYSNSGRRNDRRFTSRRNHPYQRPNDSRRHDNDYGDNQRAHGYRRRYY